MNHADVPLKEPDMQIENDTPFIAHSLPGYDQDGCDVLTHVLKGTFRARAGEPLALAEVQMPLYWADESSGRPGSSPLRHESDLALYKPGTDLMLLGHAYPPGGGKAKKIEVRFSVGAISKKVMVKSKEAQDRLPLPNGLGDGSRSPFATRSDSWGFGCLPRHRKPRLDWAGTYDDRWQRERAPFLPADFDYRFFQAAAPDLVSTPHLRGDERVQAENVSPAGTISFVLPDLEIEVQTSFCREAIARPAALDTLVLEPDENRLTLVWRQMIRCPEPIQSLRGIRIRLTSSSAAVKSEPGSSTSDPGSTGPLHASKSAS